MTFYCLQSIGLLNQFIYTCNHFGKYAIMQWPFFMKLFVLI